ncbi:hypothetical protein J2Z69_003902, partial [Paenibacillus shirakamiensis]|nr:hypothetical protein [Paenibacillus shirakamiensis]
KVAVSEGAAGSPPFYGESLPAAVTFSWVYPTIALHCKAHLTYSLFSFERAIALS